MRNRPRKKRVAGMMHTSRITQRRRLFMSPQKIYRAASPQLITTHFEPKAFLRKDVSTTGSSGISTHQPCGGLRIQSSRQTAGCSAYKHYPYGMETDLIATQNCSHGSGDEDPAAPTTNTAIDCSGYAMFSQGDLGAMHVMAHRMLDSRQYETGYVILKAWLSGRNGSGSKWIHLQWHMAIFEVMLDQAKAALVRFRQHILPAVLSSDDALTDAPALLWRLSLCSARQTSLPWEPVRNRALLSLQHRSSSAFENLHNLLSLAGAGDVDSLDAWIRQEEEAGPGAGSLVHQFAVALRSLASGDYTHAAVELDALVPYVSQIGGSHAQNELFVTLRDVARLKSGSQPHEATHLQAA
jgi:hypothetical protein